MRGQGAAFSFHVCRLMPGSTAASDDGRAEPGRPRPIHLACSEAELQDALLQLAEIYGWRRAHFRPARTNKGWRTAMTGDTGFPDLTLVRDGVLVFIECKSQRGRISAEQQAWIAALNAVHGVVALVVRPADWEHVARLLAPAA